MFETRKLNDVGFDNLDRFKRTIAEAANSALSMMPDGREKSLFITKLEEAVFFGSKAITSNPAYYYDEKSYGIGPKLKSSR